jgi:hypothetical protein
MTTKKYKTKKDHFNDLSESEKLRLARKIYLYSLQKDRLILERRKNLPKWDAWADRLGEKPLPDDPDNPRPTGLTFLQMADHEFFECVTDPEEIKLMQAALKKRRLALEASKNHRNNSMAKRLEDDDPPLKKWNF